MSFNFFDLQSGRTALMWAASCGNLEVVRVLKEWGAVIDIQDEVGCPTVYFLYINLICYIGRVYVYIFILY